MEDFHDVIIADFLGWHHLFVRPLGLGVAAGSTNAIAMVRDAIGMVRAGRAQVSADSKAGAGLVGV